MRRSLFEEVGDASDECEFGAVGVEVEEVPIVDEGGTAAHARKVHELLFVAVAAQLPFAPDFLDHFVLGPFVAEVIGFDDALHGEHRVFPPFVPEKALRFGDELRERYLFVLGLFALQIVLRLSPRFGLQLLSAVIVAAIGWVLLDSDIPLISFALIDSADCVDCFHEVFVEVIAVGVGLYLSLDQIHQFFNRFFDFMR